MKQASAGGLINGAALSFDTVRFHALVASGPQEAANMADRDENAAKLAEMDVR